MVNFQNVNRLDKLIQKLWECRLSPKTPTVRPAYIIICLTFFGLPFAHFCYECPCRSSNAVKLPDPGAVTLPAKGKTIIFFLSQSHINGYKFKATKTSRTFLIIHIILRAGVNPTIKMHILLA